MKKVLVYLLVIVISKAQCQPNQKEDKLREATRVIKEFLTYAQSTNENRLTKIDSMFVITKCDTCNELYRRQLSHYVLEDLIKFTDFGRLDISSIKVIPYLEVEFSKEFCVKEEYKPIAYAFETEESKKKGEHKLSRYRYFLVDKGKVIAFTAFSISNDCLNFQVF